MIENIDFITLLLQTYIAFVAFATIVATLRQSFGTPLTSMQYLLFRFFVETGLLHVIMLLIPAMLHNLYPGDPMVWRTTSYLIILIPFCYMLHYLNRRRKIRDMPTPVTTKFVISGYIVMMIMTAIGLTGWFWEPSLFTVSIYFMWSMVAVVIIFLYFLGTFIYVEDEAMPFKPAE